MYEIIEIIRQVLGLKKKKLNVENRFCGTATVGERGQIVIPAEARKLLGLKHGDKMLVMSHAHAEGIVLIKIDAMKEFLSRVLEGIREADVSEDTSHKKS